MKRIRILLADDHNVVRRGLRLLLESQPEFSVVGEAADGRQAVEQAEAAKPDVVVLDITMPCMNGIQVAEHLKEIKCRTKVLFLTIHEEPEFISAAFSAGGVGYVSKLRLASDLVNAIREVFGGREFISPTLKG